MRHLKHQLFLMNPMISMLFIIHIVAVLAFLHIYWSGILSWSWIVVAIASFFLRMFFITGFYHRYFSHRNYQTSRCGQFIFGILGCTALQKGPLWWSSYYRHYHKYSTSDCNYCPSTLYSFLWSRQSWIRFNEQYGEIKSKYIADWLIYTELVWLDKLHLIPYLFLIAIVYTFAGLSGVYWGLIIPQIPLWHFTYWIYSPSPIRGTQRCLDQQQHNVVARNNRWTAFLSLGDRWYNKHHADTQTAQRESVWYEFDLTIRLLSCLNALGFIWSMMPSQMYDNEKSVSHSNLLLSTIMSMQETTDVSTMKVNQSCSSLIKKCNRYPHNAIYEGLVVHTRHHPMSNQFSYKLYLMYIELNDETTEYAFDDYWFWSSRDKHVRTFPALASFRASEYLSKRKIQDMVGEEWEHYLNNHVSRNNESDNGHSKMMNPRSISRVCLLTHFRYFGLKFNPVSYYYCFDQQDNLIAMVSEVHNTPWSEQCWYVHLVPRIIEDDTGKDQRMHCPTLELTSDLLEPNYYWTGSKPRYTDCKTKKMHVSPFFDMSYLYRVKYDSPQTILNVSWEMFTRQRDTEGRRDFYVSMRLRRVDISQSTLNRVMLQYPLMTAKVVLAIYYQAGLLYLRKVPFVTHPSKKKQILEDKINIDLH
jgi:stearoyl-CoA desaturase (Delta-9 desaturase)